MILESSGRHEPRHRAQSSFIQDSYVDSHFAGCSPELNWLADQFQNSLEHLPCTTFAESLFLLRQSATALADF